MSLTKAHCPQRSHTRQTTSIPTITAGTPSTLAPEDEGALIHSELHQLGKGRTPSSLQRLNSVQSNTYRLPPEILAQIFLHACPLVDFYTPKRTHCEFISRVNEPVATQLTLGAASVYWHSVAWSTPQLWTSIDLVFSSDWDASERLYGLLYLFLDNSGCLPLNVSIKFTYDAERAKFSSNYLASDELIDRLLRPHLQRMTKLWLYSPPLEWLCQAPKQPRLAELHISNPPDEIHLADSITLHRLSIAHTTIGVDLDIELCWSSITTLHLRDLPPDDGAKLLVRCPNLISFHLIDPQDCYYCSNSCEEQERVDVEEWLPRAAQPITLRYLRDLSWTYNDLCSWSITLTQKLQLPALQSLRWANAFNELGMDLPTSDFFRHFSSTLETLDFADNANSDSKVTFRHFIGVESSIKNLRFTNCSDDFVEDVLEDLLESRATQTMVAKRMPNLRSLTISHAKYDFQPHDPFTILRILGQQLDESNSMFRMDFNNVYALWTLGNRRKFQEMVDSGVHVEVYSNSRRLFPL